jgi:DNA-binding transcriptional regulator YiaG
MTFEELLHLTGMTQLQFAEYFSIPKRTVQNWKLGTNKCPDYLLDLMIYKLRKEGVIK